MPLTPVIVTSSKDSHYKLFIRSYYSHQKPSWKNPHAPCCHRREWHLHTKPRWHHRNVTTPRLPRHNPAHNHLFSKRGATWWQGSLFRVKNLSVVLDYTKMNTSRSNCPACWVMFAKQIDNARSTETFI